MHPCWRACGKNLNIGSMCAVSPVVHTSNISSCQKKSFLFSCGCEQFHWGKSFSFLVINVCNHGEHYETSSITASTVRIYEVICDIFTKKKLSTESGQTIKLHLSIWRILGTICFCINPFILTMLFLLDWDCAHNVGFEKCKFWSFRAMEYTVDEQVNF